eukprot:346008-Pyramimonas_sp.AAC.1
MGVTWSHVSWSLNGIRGSSFSTGMKSSLGAMFHGSGAGLELDLRLELELSWRWNCSWNWGVSANATAPRPHPSPPLPRPLGGDEKLDGWIGSQHLHPGRRDLTTPKTRLPPKPSTKGTWDL